MNTYKGYKEPDCFKQSRALRIYISQLWKKLPAYEKYMLASQIKRCCRSITAAIAEGCGRYTFTDTRNSFIIASGSVTETMEHLSAAFDGDYITEEDLKTGEAMCGTSCKLKDGYISWLDRSKTSAKTASSPIPS